MKKPRTNARHQPAKSKTRTASFPPSVLKDVPPYAHLLPKPLRAKPRHPFERLSFVRPHGSYCGGSAWDPPQPSEAILKEVLRLNDNDGSIFSNHDIPVRDYVIGNSVGQSAAREYVEYLCTYSTDDDGGSLQSIVFDMLGTPADQSRRGEAIGFFYELEELLRPLVRGDAPDVTTASNTLSAEETTRSARKRRR